MATKTEPNSLPAVKSENNPYKKDNRNSNQTTPNKDHAGNKRPGNYNNSNQNQGRYSGNQRDRNDIKNQQNVEGNDKNDKSEGEKKFTGRCRLFVGNLTPDVTESDFRKMFEPYGEISEVYVNTSRGFGFIRLDYRQNAEAAKAALDGHQRKGRVLRVRFATHGAALKVKNLHPYVSNELLEQSFSQFGDLERCIVIVDDRGKATGEGIVEFARKPGCNSALRRISEGVFIMGSDPKPVGVEPLEQKDEEDGMPEKFLTKTDAYKKEREKEPRFAVPGTFEYEFGMRWKQLEDVEKQRIEQVKKDTDEARMKLEAEMQTALYDYQAEKIRQDMLRQQEELRRLEELKNNDRMRRQQELDMRRQHDDRDMNQERRHKDMMLSMRQHEIASRGRMDGPAGMRGREEMMMGERFGDRMPDHMSDRMAERMGDRMGDRMPDRMGDRMGPGQPGGFMWNEKQQREVSMRAAAEAGRGRDNMQPPVPPAGMDRGMDQRGPMMDRGGPMMERGPGDRSGPGGPNDRTATSAAAAVAAAAAAVVAQGNKANPKPLMQGGPFPGLGGGPGGPQNMGMPDNAPPMDDNHPPSDTPDNRSEPDGLPANLDGEKDATTSETHMDQGENSAPCSKSDISDTHDEENERTSSPAKVNSGQALPVCDETETSAALEDRDACEMDSQDGELHDVIGPVKHPTLPPLCGEDSEICQPESSEFHPEENVPLSENSSSSSVFPSASNDTTDYQEANSSEKSVDDDSVLYSDDVDMCSTSKNVTNTNVNESEGTTGLDSVFQRLEDRPHSCSDYVHSKHQDNSYSTIDDQHSYVSFSEMNINNERLSSPSDDANEEQSYNVNQCLPRNKSSDRSWQSFDSSHFSPTCVLNRDIKESNEVPHKSESVSQEEHVSSYVTNGDSVSSNSGDQEEIDSTVYVYTDNHNSFPNNSVEDSLTSYKQHLVDGDGMDIGAEDCEQRREILSPSIYQSYEEFSRTTGYLTGDTAESLQSYPLIAEYNTSGCEPSTWSSDEVVSTDTTPVVDVAVVSSCTDAERSPSNTITLVATSVDKPPNTSQPTMQSTVPSSINLLASTSDSHEAAMCTGDQSFRSAAARTSALVPFRHSSQAASSSTYTGMARPAVMSSTMHFAQRHPGGTTIVRHQSLSSGVAGSMAAQSTVLQQHGRATAVLQQQTMTKDGQTVLVQHRSMTTALGGAVTQQTVVQQRLAAQQQQQAVVQQRLAAQAAVAAQSPVAVQAAMYQQAALQQRAVRLAGARVYPAQTLRATPTYLGQRLVRAQGPVVQQGQVMQGSMMQQLVRQRYLGGPVMPGRVQMVAGRPVRVKMTYPREIMPIDLNR